MRHTTASFLACALLLVGAASLGGQSPQALPLVRAGDVRYLGSFLVPAAAGGGTYGTFAYGGAPLGLSSRGLYVGCHDQGALIGEITIPPIGGTATVLQPCVAIPGRAAQVAADAKLGGVLLWGGRAIVSAYSYYDASGRVQRSHTAVDPTTGATTDWVQVGGLGGGWVGGAMTPIPVEWQTLFGGPALTGQASIPIISRTSSGPSASVFSPDDVGRVSPVPATRVLGYPLAHPLAGPAANPLYQRLDTIGGIAFPAGTRSVLFIGRHGMGALCYGEAADCGGDPVSIYKGDHAYPYRFQVWAYDATDLLRVKRGEVDAWAVQPYAVWPLPEIDPSGLRAAMLPGAAAYDPVTRRLYVAPRWGGGERRIHVYAIAAAPPSTTEPPAPPPPAAETWSGTVTCTRQSSGELTCAPITLRRPPQ